MADNLILGINGNFFGTKAENIEVDSDESIIDMLNITTKNAGYKVNKCEGNDLELMFPNISVIYHYEGTKTKEVKYYLDDDCAKLPYPGTLEDKQIFQGWVTEDEKDDYENLNPKKDNIILKNNSTINLYSVVTEQQEDKLGPITETLEPTDEFYFYIKFPSGAEIFENLYNNVKFFKILPRNVRIEFKSNEDKRTIDFNEFWITSFLNGHTISKNGYDKGISIKPQETHVYYIVINTKTIFTEPFNPLSVDNRLSLRIEGSYSPSLISFDISVASPIIERYMIG